MGADTLRNDTASTARAVALRRRVEECEGVWGLGFGVWGFRVWGLGFGVWGLGLGVWGLGFGVWGLGFGVWGAILGRCRVLGFGLFL